MKYKCEMCRNKEAKHISIIVRKSGGNGTIMNLCNTCMDKVPAINRKNRI